MKNKVVEIQKIHQSNIEKIIEIGQQENNVRKDIDKSSLALILMGSFRLLVKQLDFNNKHNDLQVNTKKLINDLKILLQT